MKHFFQTTQVSLKKEPLDNIFYDISISRRQHSHHYSSNKSEKASTLTQMSYYFYNYLKYYTICQKHRHILYWNFHKTSFQVSINPI